MIKNISIFFVYKIYRIALSQEQSASVRISFLGLMSIFQLLHFLIIAVFFRNLGYEAYQINEKLFVLLFVLIGFGLNYILFIQSKIVYKINTQYRHKFPNNFKYNLLFFGYIILLFIVIFIEAYIYQNRFGK
ncbi:magnesium-transporting ATPase (P-type) [Flavobacterium sp. CAN_S2]